MKFLLTSGGVTNKCIHGELVDMLGKPIADSNALCIPTAMYGRLYAHAGYHYYSGHRAPLRVKLKRPYINTSWKKGK